MSDLHGWDDPRNLPKPALARFHGTPQEEYVAFVKLPQGTEVWRGTKGAREPGLPYIPERCYIKTSCMYDQVAVDPRTAPRCLAFVLFTNAGYAGQFCSLEGALNAGMGIGMPVARSMVREVIGRLA